MSLSLDFDGDVIFIASFHTPAAKLALQKEHKNPNRTCYDVIKELNKKAGAPHIKCMTFDEYKIEPFENLTAETNAEYVGRLTGVKAQTGPVIALAYNIMRIIENSGLERNQKLNVAVEVFLDKVGNSVFAQKHGTQSLAEIVTDAICCGDVEKLVSEGFNRGTTETIIGIVKAKAARLGVNDLANYHKWAKENGRSNIINRIVRVENRIYYASRANLECCEFLQCLKENVVDVPSKLLKWTLSGKAQQIETPLDKTIMERAMEKARIQSDKGREACKTMCEAIEEILGCKKKPMQKKGDLRKEAWAKATRNLALKSESKSCIV